MFALQKSGCVLGLALLVALLLALGGCSDSAGTAGGPLTDGDNPLISDTLGDPCVRQSDCSTGESCVEVSEGSFICSINCGSDALCEGVFPGGCCKTLDSGKFCAKTYHGCSSEDGDEPIDGDQSVDGDSGACTYDTYRCADFTTVERCSSTGKWLTYKHCGEGSCCFQGDCALMEDGGSNCETANPDQKCIPDSYRCRGPREIQRCASDGSQWDFYRTCADYESCIDGVCTDLVKDGDDVPPDGDTDNPPVDGDEEEEPCTACTIQDGCESDTQYCFAQDPTSSDGCCRTFCDLPDGDCPRGYRCSQGVCEPVEGYCISDADCDLDEFCFKRPGQTDGICDEYCFNMGNYCPSHSVCIENEQDPNYGKCVYEECVQCNYDDQCAAHPQAGPGFYCNIPLGYTDGCCIEMCSNSDDCPGGLSCCPDGRCGKNCGGNECTKTCPAGHVCDPLYDECVLNCPPCGKDECCDAASAPNCKPGCTCTNPVICGVLLRPCCLGYSCSAIVYGVLGYCI